MDFSLETDRDGAPCRGQASSARLAEHARYRNPESNTIG
jgi:hypothetical protein